MRVMWGKWGLITRCTCEGYVGEVGVDYEVYM